MKKNAPKPNQNYSILIQDNHYSKLEDIIEQVWRLGDAYSFNHTVIYGWCLATLYFVDGVVVVNRPHFDVDWYRRYLYWKIFDPVKQSHLYIFDKK